MLLLQKTIVLKKMNIKITINTILSIDTFIVMIRKHIITTEGTPKGIGTNPGITLIDTEKRESLQSDMGIKIDTVDV